MKKSNSLIQGLCAPFTEDVCSNLSNKRFETSGWQKNNFFTLKLQSADLMHFNRNNFSLSIQFF